MRATAVAFCFNAPRFISPPIMRAPAREADGLIISGIKNR
jgi:hypothetical protein